MSKFRPQVMVPLIGLGALAGFGLYQGHVEIAAGVIGGIIALAKDLISTED